MLAAQHLHSVDLSTYISIHISIYTSCQTIYIPSQKNVLNKCDRQTWAILTIFILWRYHPSATFTSMRGEEKKGVNLNTGFVCEIHFIRIFHPFRARWEDDQECAEDLRGLLFLTRIPSIVFGVKLKQIKKLMHWHSMHQFFNLFLLVHLGW